MNFKIEFNKILSDNLYLSQEEADNFEKVEISTDDCAGILRGYIINLKDFDQASFAETISGLYMSDGFSRIMDTTGILGNEIILRFLFDNKDISNPFIFYTEELYVKPENRGNHIGKLLLDRVPVAIKEEFGIDISLMLHHSAQLEENSSISQEELDIIYKKYGFNEVPEMGHVFYKYFN